MMDAGKLRSRITIEQETTSTPSTSGQRTKTWVPLLSCYANIAAPTGDLVDYAHSFSIVISRVVTIRYSTTYNITKSCRVNYGGKYFAIHAALDRQNTREFLTILCSEGQ